MRILRLYGKLISSEGVAAPAILSSLTRISTGAFSLALVIFAYSHTHSFGKAGIIIAASGFGYALGTPYEGRLIDRHGARIILMPMGAMWGLLSLCYILLLAHHSSLLLVIGVAFLAGIFTPSTSGVMRGIWRSVAVDEKEQVAAMAIESVTARVTGAFGPSIASGVLLLLSVEVATLTLLLIGCAAIVGFGFVAGDMRPARKKEGQSGINWSFLFPILLVISFYTLSTGMIDLSITALMNAHHHIKLTGLLFAMSPIGGVIGGLLYGGLRKEGRDEHRDILKTMSCVAFFWIVAIFLSFSVPLFALALFAMGAFTAPASILFFHMAAERAPGSETEAIGWVTLAMGFFYGLGRPVSGVITDHFGYHTSLAAIALPMLTGVLILAVVAWRSASITR